MISRNQWWWKMILLVDNKFYYPVIEIQAFVLCSKQSSDEEWLINLYLGRYLMFQSSSWALLLLLPPTGLLLRDSATNLAIFLDLNSTQPSVNNRSLLNLPGFLSFFSGCRNTLPTLRDRIIDYEYSQAMRLSQYMKIMSYLPYSEKNVVVCDTLYPVGTFDK